MKIIEPFNLAFHSLYSQFTRFLFFPRSSLFIIFLGAFAFHLILYSSEIFLFILYIVITKNMIKKKYSWNRLWNESENGKTTKLRKIKEVSVKSVIYIFCSVILFPYSHHSINDGVWVAFLSR